MWGHPHSYFPTRRYTSQQRSLSPSCPSLTTNSSLCSQLQTRRRFPSHHLNKRIYATSHVPNLPTNQWRAGRTARILYIRPRFQPEIQYFNIDIQRRHNYKNHSRKTAASRQCDQRPTARPQCLVDRAHHRSSEPVAAAAIPPRTSGQSTL